ncbi:tripartite tricarboxylate transporter TctB family protein [Halomonas sp. PAMB 3232]|uniref:tripartite tricarboxylate transporter TctB family protein n=1 Tax=Halomonas sp. PAMB 3232 TaxID=3075221 RepID=UPI002898A9DD|nr:tripartite tricarboxylate transporter TctB family protein [Halomonas sp. PAMB 3232]WNL38207.1 tripartite tricarboxylate transporter TctB family protein [Halomonas sp. PAMB 3232]
MFFGYVLWLRSFGYEMRAMHIFTNRDFLAGLVCLLISALVLWQAQAYDMGSLRSMGPGYLPRFLGMSLCVLGLVTMAMSAKTATAFPKLNVRALVCITVAIVVFALLMRPAGLFLATMMLVYLCGLSEKTFKPIKLTALGLVLCLISYLVFILSLNMPIRLFPWSF